jgi:hypothetical protein
MQHFLETYGGQSIIGYGKPFRGFVEAYEAPRKGLSTDGVIEASGRRLPMYTSTVQDFVEIGSTPEATLWLVETLNSVYVVSRRTV